MKTEQIEITAKLIQKERNKCKLLREAAEQILRLHLCEQEGLASGQPTRQQWFDAVDKLGKTLKL